MGVSAPHTNSSSSLAFRVHWMTTPLTKAPTMDEAELYSITFRYDGAELFDVADRLLEQGRDLSRVQLNQRNMLSEILVHLTISTLVADPDSYKRAAAKFNRVYHLLRRAGVPLTEKSPWD